MASEIFDKLPGIKMPVIEVTDTLATMWQGQYTENGQTHLLFRASQMDVVLHLGLKTTPEEALDHFNTAVNFAQKYPCRLIVLCPDNTVSGEVPLEGKLFSQCYLGDDLRDTCCCEALTLGYPTKENNYLENQVSLWLEGDLPTYYWLNRVAPEVIEKYYLKFAKGCRKVLYDSTIELDNYERIGWLNPQAVQDLAMSRLLPLRQSLGQFLSTYSPGILVEGLEEVIVRNYDSHRTEAEGLLKWQKECLNNCAQQSGKALKAKYHIMTNFEDDKHSLEIEWKYSQQDKYFKWWCSPEKATGKILALLGKGERTYPFQLTQISPAEALAEAIFY